MSGRTEILGADDRRRWRGLLTLLAIVALGFGPAAAEDRGASPHAYYLFLADAPQGCEDCYVPLLVTRASLEEVASAGIDGPTILITTYERDSIWKVERGVVLAATQVSTRDRTVRLRGRRYRYQEIAPAEVLRLPEKPEGTIPIHRLVSVPDRKSLEDLIAAFRGRP
jgi:hypothetical protein